ncbi:MAG: hypothetical protein ACT4P7_13080 [Gemmatimonadaceae bacterium]
MPGRSRRRTRRSPPPTVLIPRGVEANVPTVMAPEDPLRTGMPALDAIHSRLTIASPRTPSRVYSVLRTTEVDAYELEKAALAGVAAPSPLAPVPVGDNFKGKARKAAKLSIANVPTKTFKDLANLIKDLPSDSAMAKRKPPISKASSSKRVSKEKRNVRVSAFIYAASREDDNDFHLIIGRDLSSAQEMYMTMELSGLPPRSASSFAKLKAARDAYKGFFSGNMPGMTYDFYDPPVPVLVEGSLFFDINHATGMRPGPQSLKSRMPTIWEVHPITRIVFEP